MKFKQYLTETTPPELEISNSSGAYFTYIVRFVEKNCQQALKECKRRNNFFGEELNRKKI
jgi:hypothetical protein